LIFSPRFKITDCDLEIASAAASSRVKREAVQNVQGSIVQSEILTGNEGKGF
jgi:hypothetical protein